MNETDQILTKFKTWCDANIKDVVGHERIGLKEFDDLINNAVSELQTLTDNKSDYTSFVCGIAAGMRMMILPTNED